MRCTGRGDTDGGHCCWIAGKPCELLTEVDGMPRCSVWGEWDTPKWKTSPAGKWMTATYPGFTCADFPQNIPQVMADGVGLCCWRTD